MGKIITIVIRDASVEDRLVLNTYFKHSIPAVGPIVVKLIDPKKGAALVSLLEVLHSLDGRPIWSVEQSTLGSG